MSRTKKFLDKQKTKKTKKHIGGAAPPKPNSTQPKSNITSSKKTFGQKFPRLKAFAHAAISIATDLPLRVIGVSPSYKNPTATTIERITKQNLKGKQSWSTSDPKSAVKILSNELSELQKFRGNLNSTNAGIKHKANKELRNLNSHAKAHLSYAKQYRTSLEAARAGKKTEYVTSESITKLLEQKQNELLMAQSADKRKNDYEKKIRALKPPPDRGE